jgi:hypothetical protein
MTGFLVEKLAAELIALPLAELTAAEIAERIAGVLGDADLEIRQGALDRASEIMFQRAAAAVKHAGMLKVVERLARATNCPADANFVEWCLSRGLIERDDAGGYVVTSRAGLRAVEP